MFVIYESSDDILIFSVEAEQELIELYKRGGYDFDDYERLGPYREATVAYRGTVAGYNK